MENEIQNSLDKMILENESIENIKIQLRVLRMRFEINYETMREAILAVVLPKCFLDFETHTKYLILLKEFTISLDDEFHIIYTYATEKYIPISHNILPIIDFLVDSNIVYNGFLQWISNDTTPDYIGGTACYNNDNYIYGKKLLQISKENELYKKVLYYFTDDTNSIICTDNSSDSDCCN